MANGVLSAMLPAAGSSVVVTRPAPSWPPPAVTAARVAADSPPTGNTDMVTAASASVTICTDAGAIEMPTPGQLATIVISRQSLTRTAPGASPTSPIARVRTPRVMSSVDIQRAHAGMCTAMR